jgi:hypothetical protein
MMGNNNFERYKFGEEQKRLDRVPYIVPNATGRVSIDGQPVDVEQYVSFASRPINIMSDVVDAVDINGNRITLEGADKGQITQLYTMEVDGKPQAFVTIKRNKYDKDGYLVGTEEFQAPAEKFNADINSPKSGGAHIEGYNDAFFDNVNTTTSTPKKNIGITNEPKKKTSTQQMSGGMTQEQWNAQWAALKPGQSMKGLDGKTYTKK